MLANITQPRGISFELQEYLDGHRETTNAAALARQTRLPDGTLRDYLSGRTSPDWDVVCDIAPRLPDAVLFKLMCKLGAGRYVPEPIEPLSHADYCLIANAIELTADTVDASQAAIECGADNFICADDAAELDGWYARIIGSARRYRAELRTRIGRCVRRPFTGRAR